MPLTEAPLFKLMSARLAWLGEREVVLGQNLANADTPGYRPRDLRPADFARLAERSAAQSGRVEIARTDPAHLGVGVRARIGLASRAAESVYETTPNGNAVILEEQMAKVSQTALDHQLTSNLYRKYLGMMRIALGTER
jgi:flagellar basal-body rod protein FlgB